MGFKKMSLFFLFLFFTTSYAITDPLVDDAQLKKQRDNMGKESSLQAKISVPNEYFTRWWDIINEEMKTAGQDVSKGLTFEHVEKFLGGMLSMFIEDGQQLQRELDNLNMFFVEMKDITLKSDQKTSFRRAHQSRKFVKKLGLAFGLAHYTKHVDQNGDSNCPLDEMQKHDDWIMDTTFQFTRIAKNLGYRDQWKLRRIYNAIAASTEYGWSTEISPEDYKLCKNKAASLAGIV